MRIDVRLFANFREAAGCGSLELDVDGDEVRDALRDLFEDYPDIRRYAEVDGELRRSVRVLVNGELAEPDTALNEGDELALLPPVSGGLRLDFKAWLQNDDGEYVLGEGGADILAAIGREGSVSGAAKSLGMSNRYALERVLLMEDRAGAKLVERQRGGKGGGGSSLTEEGERLVKAYHRAQEEMRRACERLGEEI